MKHEKQRPLRLIINTRFQDVTFFNAVCFARKITKDKRAKTACLGSNKTYRKYLFKQNSIACIVSYQVMTFMTATESVQQSTSEHMHDHNAASVKQSVFVCLAMSCFFITTAKVRTSVLHNIAASRLELFCFIGCCCSCGMPV